MGAIELRDVSFCYRDNETSFLALEHIDLAVAAGEFLCLVGHSGCGKSTLLSLVAGLAQPDLGEVRVDGEPVSGPGADRAVVFQNYTLFPWMTAAKNVAFRIEHARKRVPRDEVAEAVRGYLSQVGMEHAADKYPFQLSGGMQQRVAIACALAMESDILLLDEPFGALDAKSRFELQQLLVKLWGAEARRKTVVFVTHDLNEALFLADRIAFMRPRRIERIVEVPFSRPRDWESLATTVGFRSLRSELLGLFYLDEEGGAVNAERFGKSGASSFRRDPAIGPALSAAKQPGQPGQPEQPGRPGQPVQQERQGQQGRPKQPEQPGRPGHESVAAFCSAADAARARRLRVRKGALAVVVHMLLAALVILILLPGAKTVPTSVPFLVAVALIECCYIAGMVRARGKSEAPSWITLIVWVLLIAWEVLTTQLGRLHPVLVPAPEAVFNVFATQYDVLLVNVASSVELLLVGAVTAIVFGVLLGALVGWVGPLRDVCAPIARVLAPIPSVVFAPYLVALMPTFRSASAMVVFLGLFWPTFLSTIIRVNGIDRHIIESARMLELSSFDMVRHVILPYIAPGVINGLNGQLTASIMMLTFAEMLGAKSGMGYYIINYTNFANYVNVIAGIIVVGVVVTLLNRGINAAKRRLVKWR